MILYLLDVIRYSQVQLYSDLIYRDVKITITILNMHIYTKIHVLRNSHTVKYSNDTCCMP